MKEEEVLAELFIYFCFIFFSCLWSAQTILEWENHHIVGSCFSACVAVTIIGLMIYYSRKSIKTIAIIAYIILVCPILVAGLYFLDKLKMERLVPPRLFKLLMAPLE